MAKKAGKGPMGANMRGRMAGNGGGTVKYSKGLAASGIGRVRTSRASGYKSRIAKAGEG